MQSKSSSLQKLCPNLKISKMISFNGSYPNTLKYHEGSFIYPMGSIVLIEKSQTQSFLKGHDNQITTIALSKDATILATGQLETKSSKVAESPVIVWDFRSKKLLKVLQGLNGGVKQVCISSNGDFIAASSSRNQLVVWNSKTLSSLFTKTYEKSVNILSYEETLIISIDKTLTQLHFGNSNVPSQNNFTLPSHGLSRNFTCSTSFSSFGYFIGTDGGEVCIFEKGAFKSLSQIGRGKVSSVIYQGPYVYILVGQQLVKSQFSQGTLKQIQRQVVREGVSLVKHQKDSLLLQTTFSIDRINTSNLQTVTLVSGQSSQIVGIDAKDNIVAIAQKSGQVTIRSSNKLSIISDCQYPKAIDITNVAIGDNNRIFVSHADGSVKCYKYQEGQRSTLEFEWNAHKQRTTTVFANENYIVSGGDDNVVRVWARTTRQLLGQIEVHQKSISKLLADSKIPNYIHSCSIDRTIHTYDLKTDKKVAVHQVKNGNILDMDQKKDTGQLITCGLNTPISYWVTSNPLPVGEIQFPLRLNCISVSPSGKYFVVGGELGDIYVYDAKTKSYLGRGEGHSGSVTRIKWLNDNSIVSGSEDSSLALWTFN